MKASHQFAVYERGLTKEHLTIKGEIYRDCGMEVG